MDKVRDSFVRARRLIREAWEEVALWVENNPDHPAAVILKESFAVLHDEVKNYARCHYGIGARKVRSGERHRPDQN
jgi:hypothetical protein